MQCCMTCSGGQQTVGARHVHVLPPAACPHKRSGGGLKRQPCYHCKRWTTFSPGTAQAPLTRLVVEEPGQGCGLVPRTYGPPGKVVRRTPINLVLFYVHRTEARHNGVLVAQRVGRAGQQGPACSAVKAGTPGGGPRRAQQGSPPCECVNGCLAGGPRATVAIHKHSACLDAWPCQARSAWQPKVSGAPTSERHFCRACASDLLTDD